MKRLYVKITFHLNRTNAEEIMKGTLQREINNYQPATKAGVLTISLHECVVCHYHGVS